jgi:hypothetical protein
MMQGPDRERHAEAEARLPWLASLLDAYAVLDAGLAAALVADGRKAACRSGCFACCQQRIPASTLEVHGLKWFALERLDARTRRILVRQLRDRAAGGCPFLVAGACAAYPLRPMACREYVMLGRACRPGERPEETRPGDLLPLPAAAQREAFALLLPHYGAAGSADRESGPRGRLILRDTATLQSVDWSGLAGALACKIPVDRTDGRWLSLFSQSPRIFALAELPTTIEELAQ